MQFEASHRSDQALNLTPLIDIVFLLLVFFMLTAHFVRDDGLPVDLPDAVSAEAMNNDKPLEIVISLSGEITQAGSLIQPEELEVRLAELLSTRVEKRVVIRGDDGASLGDCVKVLDAARLAGAAGVDIITEHPAGR
ncbi:MAG: biopolymer transporter ExbD [Zetaproteobacteria bacterium CG06_land_8_20_14_3_00_59_53]|nr:MAG: hypothetical protein AUK36_05855 [Zetaproteobacteria bacterium CG2_30_59_37]PIO90577.1 MAG: biopolymer transporter ExbD [Zetaproteobacteria bacterium CG23_combo_of_CG06-09_8_20_14_all_59_86]PIQ66156.1 MAG: biopolymer transporter ExbD [Zetaproteobacteria bacterium CG11_big_fil_rev_8_21_14_0_20_59_439]PIU71524.1 MAG: biopolymer transporter ExbD [Zetaproteobacteria bacterium CG06_land_8_20_14_3_00_59_53]PIU97784.1 MAG: biopolymer transporter ExbD [Zetaproteobacteria bacterium CG03_land_8_2